MTRYTKEQDTRDWEVQVCLEHGRKSNVSREKDGEGGSSLRREQPGPILRCLLTVLKMARFLIRVENVYTVRFISLLGSFRLQKRVNVDKVC